MNQTMTSNYWAEVFHHLTLANQEMANYDFNPEDDLFILALQNKWHHVLKMQEFMMSQQEFQERLRLAEEVYGLPPLD